VFPDCGRFRQRGPAALFMMVAKTLLKTEGQRLGEPTRCFPPSTRFSQRTMTPACSRRCSAPSLISRPGTCVLPMPDTIPAYHRLAGCTLSHPETRPDAGRHDRNCLCDRASHPGAGGHPLSLYRWVTEAKNPEDALYGEERLLEALQTAHQGDLAKMIHYISSEVAHHASGAPQSDDITMLAIKMSRNNVSMEYAGKGA